MKLLAFGEILWDIVGDEKYLGARALQSGGACRALRPAGRHCLRTRR